MLAHIFVGLQINAFRLIVLSRFQAPANTCECNFVIVEFPGSLVVRIPRSHRGGRGSIPRLGRLLFSLPCRVSFGNKKNKNSGSTEIWTRIAGFRVLSANHYTIEPTWLVVYFKVYIVHQHTSIGRGNVHKSTAKSEQTNKNTVGKKMRVAR